MSTLTLVLSLALLLGCEEEKVPAASRYTVQQLSDRVLLLENKDRITELEKEYAKYFQDGRFDSVTAEDSQITIRACKTRGHLKLDFCEEFTPYDIDMLLTRRKAELYEKECDCEDPDTDTGAD